MNFFFKKLWKPIGIVLIILTTINVVTDVIGAIYYVPEEYTTNDCLLADYYYVIAKIERAAKRPPSRRMFYDYYRGLKRQKERVCKNEK